MRAFTLLVIALISAAATAATTDDDDYGNYWWVCYSLSVSGTFSGVGSDFLKGTWAVNTTHVDNHDNHFYQKDDYFLYWRTVEGGYWAFSDTINSSSISGYGSGHWFGPDYVDAGTWVMINSNNDWEVQSATSLSVDCLDTASPVPAPVAKKKAVSKKKDVCNTLDVSGTYFVNENVTYAFGMKGTWAVNASHLDNSSDIHFYQKDGIFLYYNGNWTFGSDPFGSTRGSSLVYGYGVGADSGPEDVTAGTWKIWNFTSRDYKTQSASSLAVTCMDKPTPKASDVNPNLIGAIVGSICALCCCAGVAAGLIWRAKQQNTGLVPSQNQIRPAEVEGRNTGEATNKGAEAEDVKKGVEAAGEVEASAIP